MNAVIEQETKQAEDKVRNVRREYRKLEAFDYQPVPIAALERFSFLQSELTETEQAISNIRVGEKGSEKELSALLEKKAYLLESLNLVAAEASERLKVEELAFYAVRHKMLDTLKAKENAADLSVKGAFVELVQALQERWRVMQKKHELSLAFAGIADRHNTPESFGVPDMRLPSPSAKWVRTPGAPWLEKFGSIWGRRWGMVRMTNRRTSRARRMVTILSKQTREFYESQPERYKIERGGAVKDLTTNLWVDSISEMNPHAITAATSQSMHARRREIAKQAEIRALARKGGVDVDNATVEELAKGEGSAYEALVSHGYDLAMSTKTARGFEGIFSQFRTMVAGDPKSFEVRAGSGVTPDVTIANMVINILGNRPPTNENIIDAQLELAREIEQRQAAAIENARATEAEEWASTK